MSGSGGQITGSKTWITVAVMAAALMAVLDISIVNVALSDIRASFGTPLDEIAWVSTGYAMANVTIIPISGWLQRRYGYKNYFAFSIAMFTFSSALCGLAWNLPSLVIFRILQGLGGGAIIPTSQAILFSRYPAKEHGTAGALFGLGAVTGPLLGPTLGGYLTDVASWHWIFYINVPVGIAAAIIAYRSIEEPGFEPSRDPIDVVGIGLLAAGMVSLQYVLEEGNRDGWLESPLIAVLAVCAGVSLITFVVHELETEYPVVDFSVFRNRSYGASSALNFLIGTALFGGSFLFSLYCGSVMHYDAFHIGMLFLEGSWIQLFMMPIVGKLVGKIDSRYLIFAGLALNVLSLWFNGTLNQTADNHAMVLPIFVRAVGLSMCFVPLSVVALSDLPPNKRGGAAGIFNLTRELGGTIGTAWMATALSTHTKQVATDLSAHVDVFNPLTQEALATAQHGIAARTWDPQFGSLALLNLRVQGQALIGAFNIGFLQLAVGFALSLGLVFVLAKPRGGPVAGAH
ncbi:MAG: DHA2 family efflux MFS transporter permease subunit [Polyangiaceae bacterium]